VHLLALGVVTMDRREAPRFNLSVPVSFMWTIPGVGVRSGTGTTRNVSLQGLFVVTDIRPVAGSFVRLRVMLRSSSGLDLVLRARGTVLRVESAGDSTSGVGFAATTTRYVFEKLRQRASTGDSARKNSVKS
jgi:hypothetical protein